MGSPPPTRFYLVGQLTTKEATFFWGASKKYSFILQGGRQKTLDMFPLIIGEMDFPRASVLFKMIIDNIMS